MAQNKLNKELKNLANDPMPQVRHQTLGAAFPQDNHRALGIGLQ